MADRHTGQIVPCLVEHRQNLTVPACKHMMTKMQAIYFSDFRLISNFLENCANDVNKLKCGRIPTEDEEEVCFANSDLWSINSLIFLNSNHFLFT